MSFTLTPLAAALIAAVGAACVVLVLIIRRHFTLRYRIEYTLEFVEHYRLFVTSVRANQPDERQLVWLSARAGRMQEIMGSSGLIEYWSPEERLLERGFAVVTRTFDELAAGRLPDHLMATCQLTLIRYLSSLQERYR